MKKISLFIGTLALGASLSMASGGWQGAGSVTTFTVIDSNVGEVCEVQVGGTVYVFKVDDEGSKAMVDDIRTALERGADLNIYADAAVTLSYTPVSATAQNKVVAIGVSQ